MTILFMSIGALVLFFLGHLLGMRHERNYGEAACQKLMDEEIAEYYKEQNEWEAGASSDSALLDYEPASRRIKRYEVR